MIIMQEDYNRFDIMFEDAEEYLEQKEKELEELKIAAAEERKEIERKGLCQGCETRGYNRWVHNDECYLCWDCFIHDLQCQSGVSVPVTRYDEMKEYISSGEWEELWENNE